MDPAIPAVTVNTVEPVIIENCQLRGRGHLVSALKDSTNLTIRNCVGIGLNPNKANVRTGRFAIIYKPNTLKIERNTLISNAGIYTIGAGASANSITVRFNTANNIDGRTSNGSGGYIPDASWCAQFIQLNGVRSTPNIDISWNQIINEPGKSCSEENINMYKASGTAASPIKITNNYVQGAYGTNPMATSYSGGGIIADGGSSNIAEETGFLSIRDNHIVGTQNQGIAVSAGHDVDVRNNRVIGSGLLPDGRRMVTANVGIYVYNYYKTNSTFFNNTVTANVVGWINKSGSLNNFWFPDCTGTNVCNYNQPLSGAITLAMEASEFVLWKSKLVINGVTVGSTLPH